VDPAIAEAVERRTAALRALSARAFPEADVGRAAGPPVEAELHTAVCDGKVTLTAAHQAIASDWTTALAKLSLGAEEHPCQIMR
jgi:hypothetical protein